MDIIEKHFSSKKDGDFKVLKFIENRKIGNKIVKYFLIEFVDTRYKVKCNKSSIVSGEIKDYLKPNPVHKGFLGGKKYSSTHFLYKRWKCMMERCYRSKNKDYKSYGAVGARVDERWHNFQNYVEDVMQLKDYNENKIKNNILELDKDILYENNKLYSNKTCIWINKLENNRHHTIHQFPNHIIIDTIDGIKYYIDNMKEFCKQHEWITIDGLRPARKSKNLYKKRWYILYEKDYNENKEFYDLYLLSLPKEGEINE